MKAATLNEIKRELGTREPERLLEFCLRLAKFKKESKELLTYLLFESDHESSYIESVKNEMDTLFLELNRGNMYFVKKGLRRILRMVNRQIKYSGIKQTEVELRIYFCDKMKNSTVQIEWSAVLVNLYHQQLKKINAALATLPEDLRFDYQQALSALTLRG